MPWTAEDQRVFLLSEDLRYVLNLGAELLGPVHCRRECCFAAPCECFTTFHMFSCFFHTFCCLLLPASEHVAFQFLGVNMFPIATMSFGLSCYLGQPLRQNKPRQSKQCHYFTSPRLVTLLFMLFHLMISCDHEFLVEFLV